VEHESDADNVNALDEVPDSSWYTNRRPTPEQAAAGACAGVAPPRLPFVVLSAKEAGLTPGLVVRDADGRQYALKFDQHPSDQPEISTAADVIASRLYWALGYNVPCNEVAWIDATQLSLGAGAHYLDQYGRRRPLDMPRVRDALAHGTRRADGATRVSLSLFVEGTPLGPWAGEGRRDDDPNDRVSHQERRELRGERLLAAWVNHWDSREPNTLDTFVRVPGGGGYVRHYFIDFADTLGSEPLDVSRAPYAGFAEQVRPDRLAIDFLSFGVARRPWDDAALDRRPATMRYFTAERFDPESWEPSIPVPRYGYARDEDLAWMARKIARLTPDHVRAVVPMARLSDPAVERHILAALLGRRERLLRWSFEHDSPMADVAVQRGELLCMTDLAIETGVSTPQQTRYEVELRAGVDLARLNTPIRLHHGTQYGEICVGLPGHLAPAGVRDDAPERYTTVNVVRHDPHGHTRLRAHLYDLGPARGYVLAGVER
jgi:hypothetical protein